jgi:arylsulfatase B/arylsulfatase I/J
VLEAARWNLTTTTRACVRFCAWAVAHSLGYFKPEYTPTYRGFDSFFGFYTGGETHYSHITPHGGPGEFGPGADPNQLDGLCHGQQGLGCSTWTPQHGATHPPGYSGSTCYLFDLSNNSGTTLLPADRSLNGTFSTELYAKEATRLIAHHAALYPASGGSAAAGSAKPFYMYLAWHVVHMPLEAPAAALALQPNLTNSNRRTMLAMVTSLDDGVGQVVDALSEAVIHCKSASFVTKWLILSICFESQC